MIVVSGDGSEIVEGVVATVAKEASTSELCDALSRALSASRRQSVLYVEDDPYLHEIFQQNFGEKVCLTGARTLADARATVAENEFDLVLLDLELPDGDGAELLEELPASTPVVVFSAYDVDPQISQRVRVAKTKSRANETDVVEAVLRVLKDSDAQGLSKIDFD